MRGIPLHSLRVSARVPFPHPIVSAFAPAVILPISSVVSRLYPYIGSAAIRDAVDPASPRHEVMSPAGVHAWLLSQGEVWPEKREIVFTYVVLPPACLFIADRRSEHVACARGGEVLAAGEITCSRRGDDIEVVETSNLSTGYCPESSSYEALDRALTAAGFDSFGPYSYPFEFRRCSGCGGIQVIKDDVFECASCGDDLPETWNVSPMI